MARVTIDDCLKTVPNRFDLTLAASMRARQLANGASPLVDQVRNSKPTVTALREIAANQVTSDILKRKI